jgi:hypothetical protein
LIVKHKDLTRYWPTFVTWQYIQGLIGKPEKNERFEGLDVDGRTILKWIFKKYNGKGWN